MRLDKFMSAAGVSSRKETALLVKKGRILVNGIPAKKPDMHIDPSDPVMLDGVPVIYREHIFIMMNKPLGIVSATEDPNEKTVVDLLPEQLQRQHLFPCGRLDKNTTGFVLLTSEGQLSHRILSPKRHVEKTYRFTVKYPLSPDDIVLLSAGVTIKADSHASEWKTAPCTVSVDKTDPTSGEIILTEGKYHQIKRMMEAVHNQITSLSRISFAGIDLDPALALGEWRFLTDAEEKMLRYAADT